MGQGCFVWAGGEVGESGLKPGSCVADPPPGQASAGNPFILAPLSDALCFLFPLHTALGLTARCCRNDSTLQSRPARVRAAVLAGGGVGGGGGESKLLWCEHLK